MNSKIKEARLNAQLTQAGMGRLLSIPLSTIKDWEGGKRKPPEYVERMIIEHLHGFKLSHDYRLLMGGVVIMNRIKLLHGDCLEIMKDIPDKSIDMILADLPYGTTRNKWDSIIPFEPLWEQYERIIKDNGAIVLTAQTPFDKILGASNLKYLKYEWIWQKNKATGHLNAKKMPMKSHENILVFYKKLPTYNPQGLIEKEKPTINKGNRGVKPQGAGGGNYGKSDKDAIQTHEGYPKDILTFNVVMRPEHPTQKPVPLFEYLVKTYTNEGETVLDNCMGSGSTGVACINTNRNFIGIELDDKYFDIAEQRIRESRRKLRDEGKENRL